MTYLPPAKFRHLQTQDCKITNVWDIFLSSVCASLTDRPTEPWQDIYTDLSGKVRTASVTGVKYFALLGEIYFACRRSISPYFVDSYSESKHVEFLTSKDHFIFGYKRFICYLGRHPKTLRSDQGTEILNKELTAFLQAHHTNHIVCSKDEHASIGVAENKKDSNAVFENSIGKKEIALESFAHPPGIIKQ